MIERGHLIELIGTTGTGKTTFAKDLGRALGANVLLETADGNPHIADAHHGGEHSWANQIWFLRKYVERLDLATKLIKDGKIVIIDTGLPTYTLHTKLLIPERSNEFNGLAAGLTQHLVLPDLTLYLTDTTNFLMERLKTRNQKFDDATPDFIEQLTKLHNDWVARATTPVITIRSRDLEHKGLKSDIIKTIVLTLNYAKP